jgi:hypothetical protein
VALAHARANDADCVGRGQKLWLCGGVRNTWADGPAGGIAIGNVYITEAGVRDTLNKPRLLAHEAKHSDQWAILGSKFAVIYLGTDGVPGLIGLCGPFEGWAGYADGGYERCT